ncbi:MAG TPA: hypothetical protein VNA20_03690 [Frankiaceae bacterium]|nr:hypothetical protein [Frankiaceae bacterium]
MRNLIRLSAAAALGIAIVTSGLASADPLPFRECREDEAATETQIGGDGLLTVYTDDLATYAGVCGLERGGYVHVNEVGPAVDGEHALVEGRTGVKEVDKTLYGGHGEVWVQGGQAEGNCAPAGDNRLGNNEGTNVHRELPTVYTDGGATHAGVCDERGNRVEVNDVNSVLAGDPVDVELAP